jgi:hypothetical protein
MAGFLDFLSPTLANPRMAAQIGSPLLSALLMKGGGGGGGAVPPPADVAAGPQVGQQVGSDMTDAGKAANVITNLPTMSNPADFGADATQGINDALTANAAKPRGFLDRIGDFLHSDEGRAALLRSGAATLTGGLGAGVAAGADFMDRRRKERAVAASDEADRALRTRALDDTRDYRMGELDLQDMQNHETARHNRAGESNDRYGIDSATYRTELTDRGATRRTQMEQGGANYRTHVTTGEQRYEHETPSGSTLASEAGANYRATLPGKPDYGYSETAETTDDPGSNGFFGIGARPPLKKVTTTRTPIRPSQVQPADGTVQQITSDAEYAALPSGAKFRGPDGQVRIKP